MADRLTAGLNWALPTVLPPVFAADPAYEVTETLQTQVPNATARTKMPLALKSHIGGATGIRYPPSNSSCRLPGAVSL